MSVVKVSMLELRKALEASWDSATSYRGVSAPSSPALGQCYVSARIVQIFFPATEIVEGEVWNGECVEKHFWNILVSDSEEYHIDFTWQQFPKGSFVRSFKVRARDSLGDSQASVERCDILLNRVSDFISRHRAS
jgi:hypothetical protein